MISSLGKDDKVQMVEIIEYDGMVRLVGNFKKDYMVQMVEIFRKYDIVRLVWSYIKDHIVYFVGSLGKISQRNYDKIGWTFVFGLG